MPRDAVAEDPSARRVEQVAASLVGLVAFVVYAMTLYRTLPGGDSGELVGAVASGGVIHPPGYPLYSLLGSVFLHAVPTGSLAFRLNLLSATCDAFAAALLTLVVARTMRSAWAGLVTGALFAFAPGIWRYALVAEVFALNNLIVALLLWLAVLYEETRDRRYAFGGAFVVGLGLSNHQTVLFTAIPVVVWALVASRGELLRPAALVRLVLAGLAGLLPYAYLPIAASHHAFVSWGAADTWDGFWTHVLRREYGTFRLAPVGVGVDIAAADVRVAWWNFAREQMGPWASLVGLVGVAACFKEGWKRPRSLAPWALVPPFLSVVVMMQLGNLPVGQPLYREIVARFWQEPEIFLCIFAGVGFAVVMAAVATAPRAAPVRLAWLAPGAAVVIATLQLSLHYGDLDRHENHLVEDYAAEILRAAPEGALLVTKGDLITNGLRYLQLDAHLRPDVRIVDQELLATAWGRPLFARNDPSVAFPGPRLSLDPSVGFQLKAFFDANASAPIMVCGGLAPGDHTTDASYGLWPASFCDDVHSGTEPVSLDDWLARSAAATPHIDFAGQAHPSGSWEDIVWSDYWESRQSRAAHILTIAGNNPARRRYIPIAVDILQHIVDENANVPAHVHKNLAVAIGRAGIETPEQRAQAARAWEGYLRVAPRTDPQIPEIQKELERLTRGG
jgi:hypothetical protein